METHLDRRREFPCAPFQHHGHVLARMLRAGKEQRDSPGAHDRHDAAGEYTRTFIPGLAPQPQNAHAGVVVVQHAALCGLPDQLVPNRMEQFRSRFHQFPLRCGRQRHP